MEDRLLFIYLLSLRLLSLFYTHTHTHTHTHTLARTFVFAAMLTPGQLGGPSAATFISMPELRLSFLLSRRFQRCLPPVERTDWGL